MSHADIIARNRPALAGLSRNELVAEYLWCEQASSRALDEIDLHALSSRRRAIEDLLRGAGGALAMANPNPRSRGSGMVELKVTTPFAIALAAAMTGRPADVGPVDPVKPAPVAPVDPGVLAGSVGPVGPVGPSYSATTMDRLLAQLQRIHEELDDLKKTYAGSVSLRYQSLNDQCDLLEKILCVPLSHPRASQEDR